MKKFGSFLELYAYRYKALLTKEPLDPEVQVKGVVYKLNGNNYEKVTPKVYKALLTQSGTNAPTATILENTLGDIVWSRSDVGEYYGALSGAFLVDKTFVQITSTSTMNYFYGINRASNSAIGIYTNDDSNMPADGLLNSTPVIIEVY